MLHINKQGEASHFETLLQAGASVHAPDMINANECCFGTPQRYCHVPTCQIFHKETQRSTIRLTMEGPVMVDYVQHLTVSLIRLSAA